MKKGINPAALIVVFTLFLATAASEQKSFASLNHIAINVADLKKSMAFYEGILKLDTIPEPFHDGKHKWFKIGAHSQLHLIQRATSVSSHDKTNHICFSVASIEDFIGNLKRAGIAYEDLVGQPNVVTLRPDGVKQIYLTDPDGYWIEINNDSY